MFGRASKIRKAVERSVNAALAGEGDDAFAAIEKLRDKEKVDAYVDVCEALVFDEAFEAADRAVDQALALAPKELYVLHAKAEVASESGRPEDALAIYRTMHGLAPEDPAVLSGLATLLLANHDAPAAAELLEPHRDGDDALLRLRLGEALFAADRSEEALAVLERVHDHYISALKHASFVDNPQEIQVHLGEAARLRDDVYAEIHGREAVIEKHAKTGQLDGRTGANYTLLGQSLAAKSSHAPATTTLETVAASRTRAAQLLESAPEDPLGLTVRGCADLREGAVESAVEAFETATAGDGQFFAGFLGLGAAMEHQAGKWLACARRLERAESHPDLPTVVPDWPVLTELEQRVVWASVEPFASALSTLAEAGSVIRLVPIDVRAPDLEGFADAAGLKFVDHRSMQAINGVATPKLAMAKIEGLLDVAGDHAWTFAHEFAHLVLFAAEPAFQEQVAALYDAALRAQYAVTAYQTSDPHELFAVAYQDYLCHRHPFGVVEDLDPAGIGEGLFELIDGYPG